MTEYIMKIETYQLSKNKRFIQFVDVTGGQQIVPVISLQLHETLIVAATDDDDGESKYVIISNGHQMEVDAITFLEISEYLI